MKQKNQEKFSQSEILKGVQDLISNQDLNFLTKILEEINFGRVLFPWRNIKPRGDYYQVVAARDALLFKKAIVIKTKKSSKFPSAAFFIRFCNKGHRINSFFSQFILDNEQKLLSNPDLIYEAGQKLSYYNLSFRTLQAAQDFCDLVLRAGNYHTL